MRRCGEEQCAENDIGEEYLRGGNNGRVNSNVAHKLELGDGDASALVNLILALIPPALAKWFLNALLLMVLKYTSTPMHVELLATMLAENPMAHELSSHHAVGGPFVAQ